MIQHFDFQKLSGADQIARHLDVRLAWRRVRAWTMSSRWILSIPTSQRCQKRFVVMPTWVDCRIITTRRGRRHDANEYLHSTRCATVGTAAPPGVPEHVLSIQPFIETVKPAGRFALRFGMQCLL